MRRKLIFVYVCCSFFLGAQNIFGREAEALFKDDQLSAFLFPDLNLGCRTSQDQLKNESLEFIQSFKNKPNLKYGLSQADELSKVFNGIIVFIDNLSSQSINHSSLFLKNYPTPNQKSLVFDCKSKSRRYWKHSLIHETTHLLLAEKKIDSWFEEGLAQLNELNSGGLQPQVTVEEFSKNAIRIFNPFSLKRPLQGSSQYALALLFLRYIESQFPTPGLLNSMALENRKECEHIKDFWSKGVCQGRGFLNRHLKGEGKERVLSRFTEPGLLRYFVTALVLNHTKFSYYQIEDWSGFQFRPADEKTIRDVIEVQQLKKGDFFYFSASEWNVSLQAWARTHRNLELYYVEKSSKTFRIIPMIDGLTTSIDSLKNSNENTQKIIFGLVP